MVESHESPSAQDAGGLSGMQFPGRKTENPVRAQAALAALKREFAVECLRIAAVKSFHAADNLLLLDDRSAERDLRIAAKQIREATRAFRELGGSSS